MTTSVLTQVPDPNISTSIATDQLSLVRMYHHVIDSDVVSMTVVSLHVSRPRVPDLDGPVFARAHEPFPLAVPLYGGDVVCVSLERHGCGG